METLLEYHMRVLNIVSAIFVFAVLFLTLNAEAEECQYENMTVASDQSLVLEDAAMPKHILPPPPIFLGMMTLFGACSSAFFVHHAVVPILKTNQNAKIRKCQRDPNYMSKSPTP